MILWTGKRGAAFVYLKDTAPWVSNRVSMNVTLFQCGNGPVRISAITSGGRQAMVFKVNTFGEKVFLDCLKKILD